MYNIHRSNTLNMDYSSYIKQFSKSIVACHSKAHAAPIKIFLVSINLYYPLKYLGLIKTAGNAWKNVSGMCELLAFNMVH